MELLCQYGGDAHLRICRNFQPYGYQPSFPSISDRLGNSCSNCSNCCYCHSPTLLFTAALYQNFTPCFMLCSRNRHKRRFPEALGANPPRPSFSQALFFLQPAYCLKLQFYKNLINCTDCIFKIVVGYANDNIQFAGALVYHPDIYVSMRQCGKNPPCRSPCRFHAAPYHCKQLQIRLDIHPNSVCRPI